MRDGRDVTLSIHKEWIRRREVFNNREGKLHLNFRKAYVVLKRWLRRQPSLHYKARALWFETQGHFLDASKHLSRQRWNGLVGWGPRFRGWEAVFNASSLLQFNACQWSKCVESIDQNWHNIASQNRLVIRYEDLLEDGKGVIVKILKFLQLGAHRGFFEAIPKINRHNVHKWQQEFSKEQIEEIHPIVTPMLTRLAYRPNPMCPALLEKRRQTETSAPYHH
jgi:hypothetical protein